ncbi:uncharacterized protein [Arachis hypogaea]|uniref:uncharacterized protein n=1 Tax=Arachis hypogaea TaxID=3818 RepID=UPI003B20C622
MNPLKCTFGVSTGNFLGFVVHKKGIAIDKNKADVILALSAPKSKKEVQSFLEKVNYVRRFISNLSDRTRVFAPLVKLKNASENTIGCKLAQDDENGHERAVYYLSRVLTDIETRYSPIEKLCLSLYHAYFLVDNSKDLNDQGTNIFDVEVNYWKLYFNGSKHKDGAGVRILIISPEGIPSEFLFELKYPCSNNVAEYEDLILGLEILIDKGALEVQILGDSQLVLKQLSKEFKCNNETLQKYLVTAWELLTSFRKVSLVYIPRIHNEISNELAQIASKYWIGPETIKKLSTIHQILVPANEREVLCMSEWDDSNWRKPIARYLKDSNITIDRKLKLKAMNFVLLAGELYKKGIDGSLLRCLSREYQNIALGEVYNGICGAHQAGKKMRWVLYRNHENGQVKAANKILIGLIKKHIRNRPRTWHETLSQVLWAYRNSPRGSIGTSPYKLVYGHAAVLPLEINLNTLRVSKQSELPVDDYWNAMFDELYELDSERILALDNVIRQKESIARSYNRRIKEKSFKIGELVLKVILPMEKKSKFLGKWSHNWEGPFQLIGVFSGNAYQIKDIESGKVVNSINGKYLKYFYCWEI